MGLCTNAGLVIVSVESNRFCATASAGQHANRHIDDQSGRGVELSAGRGTDDIAAACFQHFTSGGAIQSPFVVA